LKTIHFLAPGEMGSLLLQWNLTPKVTVRP
jgi:hypothetical protein